MVLQSPGSGSGFSSEQAAGMKQERPYAHAPYQQLLEKKSWSQSCGAIFPASLTLLKLPCRLAFPRPAYQRPFPRV